MTVPARRANVPPYLDGLNDQQLAAVTATEGCLRVIAGAGTGKTRVLVQRYAYLVEGLGIDPGTIACVTFTNKAADEMRRRIRALIGPCSDTSLVATYDSLATRVLREDIERLFWPSTFRIADREEQKEILADVYERLGVRMDAASFEKVVARTAAEKASGGYIPGLLSRERVRVLPHPSRDAVDDLVEAYLQRQRRDFILDFDDLLGLAQHLLDGCDEARERWQRRLTYLMVDEFQDSTADELRFVDTLAGLSRNLMVVGDPDQSIYEWRGSDPRLLVDFADTHDPCETLFLTRNYRCTPQILACANALITHNAVRVPKDLVAERPAGAPVVHLHAASEAEEVAWVVDRIQQMHDRGMAWRDVAILYRASYLSGPIERQLMERGVPYRILGGVRFLQRMEIADAVAYLRLVVQDDDYAFARIVNTPRRRMGRARLRHLRQLQQAADDAAAGGGRDALVTTPPVGVARTPRSLFSLLREHLGDPELKGSGARSFVDLIEHLRERMDGLGVADFVDLVLTESRYEAYVRELGNMERLDNLAAFKRMAHAFETDAGEEVTIRDFLDALTLGAGDLVPDDGTDCVPLMTIHQAKGLEFPCVILMGMTEGAFPSARTLDERHERGLEEERRLCYVALTRARDLLVMTDAEGYLGRAPRIPSRFLAEMGEGSYERIGVIPEPLAARMRALAGSHADDAREDEAGWVGQRVIHPVFGPGTIVERDAGGTSFRVDFDALATPRHLSTAFLARLLGQQDDGTGATPVQVTVSPHRTA